MNIDLQQKLNRYKIHILKNKKVDGRMRIENPSQKKIKNPNFIITLVVSFVNVVTSA
jgi:hypothetical protein